MMSPIQLATLVAFALIIGGDFGFGMSRLFEALILAWRTVRAERRTRRKNVAASALFDELTRLSKVFDAKYDTLLNGSFNRAIAFWPRVLIHGRPNAEQMANRLRAILHLNDDFEWFFKQLTEPIPLWGPENPRILAVGEQIDVTEPRKLFEECRDHPDADWEHPHFTDFWQAIAATLEAFNVWSAKSCEAASLHGLSPTERGKVASTFQTDLRTAPEALRTSTSRLNAARRRKTWILSHLWRWVSGNLATLRIILSKDWKEHLADAVVSPLIVTVVFLTAAYLFTGRVAFVYMSIAALAGAFGGLVIGLVSGFGIAYFKGRRRHIHIKLVGAFVGSLLAMLLVYTVALRSPQLGLSSPAQPPERRPILKI